jgi:plastocyanin
VTFTSTSKRGDAKITDETWDLDGDGTFGDATGPVAQWTFPAAGSYKVRLRVTDARGSAATSSRTVRVVDAPPPPLAPPPAPPPPTRNIGPAAAFSFAPAAPLVGQLVTFTSTSTDPDGTIAKLAWDLDGDGRFGDATGATARASFQQAGTHTVSLRATDDAGTSSVAFQTITVTAPPLRPPHHASAPLINPFPVVRIRGVIVGRGVRVNLFTVHTARGALVSILCRGAGCPSGVIRVRVPTARRPLRIRRLERALRAGAVIDIRVTMAGRTGKYTRFVIRRGSPPSRHDLCISPASARPIHCPSS